MSKRVLVTGATGFLGRRVFESFQQAGWLATGTGHSRAKPPSILKVDLTDEEAVHALVRETRPDVVVHCAANRFPDKVDKDPTAARAINRDATQFLVDACKAHSSLCIYISTDYVFPGLPGQSPYGTEAEPSPPNLYGQTKLDGERVVLKSDNGIVLRVPVLYGKADQPSDSAINVLLDAVWKAQNEGTKVEMDHYSLRYPTHTQDVGRVLVDLAKLHLDTKDAKQHSSRLFQFTSEDKYTKYEICVILADILGLRLDNMIAKTDAGDPHASVQRPYDTHLSTRALKDIGIDVTTQDFKAWWQQELSQKQTQEH